MQNRSEMLTLITEVRGRLDELERLVQFGPDYTVLTPMSFEDPGVEDITPDGYRLFRQSGVIDSPLLERFTPVSTFVQFAAPNEETRCELASFELSDLHLNDAKPGFGLTMMAVGDQQDWFAFEFFAPGIDLKAWQWTEWVLKISTHAPSTVFSQFILHGDGEPVFVVIDSHEVSEYATFFHFKLDRSSIPSEKLESIQQVRLVLSTGGHMIGLNIYAYGVYGRR